MSPNEYNIKGDIGKNTQLLQEKNSDGILFTPQYVVKEIVENEKVESSPSPKPSEISLIYNAPLSLIGRNPVRLVIVSKDSGGAPARIQNIQLTHTKGTFDSVQIHETEGHLGEFDGMYYVDIEKNIPGTYTPILTIDSQKQVLQPISFVFDCKKNIKICLQNPQELFDYIKVKVGDILNRR